MVPVAIGIGVLTAAGLGAWYYFGRPTTPPGKVAQGRAGPSRPSRHDPSRPRRPTPTPADPGRRRDRAPSTALPVTTPPAPPVRLATPTPSLPPPPRGPDPPGAAARRGTAWRVPDSSSIGATTRRRAKASPRPCGRRPRPATACSCSWPAPTRRSGRRSQRRRARAAHPPRELQGPQLLSPLLGPLRQRVPRRLRPSARSRRTSGRAGPSPRSRPPPASFPDLVLRASRSFPAGRPGSRPLFSRWLAGGRHDHPHQRPGDPGGPRLVRGHPAPLREGRRGLWPAPEPREAARPASRPPPGPRSRRQRRPRPARAGRRRGGPPGAARGRPRSRARSAALQTLAEALLALGDARGARDRALQALRVDDRNARVSRRSSGDALARPGRPPGAEEAYRLSLRLRPDPAVERKLKRDRGPLVRRRRRCPVPRPPRPRSPGLRERLPPALRRRRQRGPGRLGPARARPPPTPSTRPGSASAPTSPIDVAFRRASRSRTRGRPPGPRAGAPTGPSRCRCRGSTRQDPAAFVRVLRHELAHSFVTWRTGNNCPTWLQEGIAQWLEGGDPARNDAGLARAGREPASFPRSSPSRARSTPCPRPRPRWPMRPASPRSPTSSQARARPGWCACSRPWATSCRPKRRCRWPWPSAIRSSRRAGPTALKRGRRQAAGRGYPRR